MKRVLKQEEKRNSFYFSSHQFCIHQIFCFFMVAVAVIGLCGCSEDEFPGEKSAESFCVSLSLQAEGSRAPADVALGRDMYLFYAVYPHGENDAVVSTFYEEKTGNCAGGILLAAGSSMLNLELDLVTGFAYDIVFWAQGYSGDDASCPFMWDEHDRSMTVDYTKAVCGDSARDAFCMVYSFTAGERNTHQVTLRRPFAQLNFGTADLAATRHAGKDFKFAGLTVENVPDRLVFGENGVATSGGKSVTFAPQPIGGSFPAGEGNELLANVLIPTPGSEQVVIPEITLNMACADGIAKPLRPFYNIPIRANYRTNIYGNLLTSQTDFTVSCEPGYSEDLLQEWERPIEAKPWDGTTLLAVEPQMMAVDGQQRKVVKIGDAAQWAFVADDLNRNRRESKFHDASIYLTADLDFNGKELSPLAQIDIDLTNVSYSDKLTKNEVRDDFDYPTYYTGSVYGNGHTLKNITMTLEQTRYNAPIGHLGGQDSSVRDLRVENISFKCATPVGTSSNGYFYKEAGIVGYVKMGNQRGEYPVFEISNCSVKNMESEIYRSYNAIHFSGGLVGVVRDAKVRMDDCYADGMNIKNVGWLLLDVSSKTNKHSAGCGGLIGAVIGGNEVNVKGFVTGLKTSVRYDSTFYNIYNSYKFVNRYDVVANGYLIGYVHVSKQNPVNVILELTDSFSNRVELWQENDEWAELDKTINYGPTTCVDAHKCVAFGRYYIGYSDNETVKRTDPALPYNLRVINPGTSDITYSMPAE